MKPTKLAEITPSYVVECFVRHKLTPIHGQLAPGNNSKCCALGAVAIDLGADPTTKNGHYLERVLREWFGSAIGFKDFVQGFDTTLSCWYSYDKTVAEKELFKTGNAITLLGKEAALACAKHFYP